MSFDFDDYVFAVDWAQRTGGYVFDDDYDGDPQLRLYVDGRQIGSTEAVANWPRIAFVVFFTLHRPRT